MWSDTRGAPYSRAARRRTGAGYAPKPLATWMRRTGGIPTTSGADPVGHILLLAARAPRRRARRPLVPRAGRLPDHAVHRRARRRHAVDDRRLADRQPHARRRWPTTTSWSRSPASTRRSCRRSSPPGSVVGAGAARRSPPSSASRPRPCRHRHCPTCTRPPSVPGAIGLGEPHMSISTTPGSALRCRARRPTCCGMQASGPGPRPTRRTSSPTTRSPPAAACSGGATRSRPDASLRRAAGRGRRRRRRAPAGCCSRRGSTGERSPVDDRHARGRLPRRVAETATRGHLTRAVLEGVAYNARWLLGCAEKFVEPPARRHPARRRRRPLGPVVPDPGRRHATGRSSGSPTPGSPGSAARRCSPALALGDVDARRGARRWCPPTSRSGPTRARGRRTTPGRRAPRSSTRRRRGSSAEGRPALIRPAFVDP